MEGVRNSTTGVVILLRFRIEAPTRHVNSVDYEQIFPNGGDVADEHQDGTAIATIRRFLLMRPTKEDR